MNGIELIGWDLLRHGGLLLDAPRLKRIAEYVPERLSSWQEKELRRQAGAILDGSANTADFVRFVLEEICGLNAATGVWQRGPQVGPEWNRRAVTGESVKPRHLWRASDDSILPVFLDDESRLGVGRSRRSISQVLQWLRGGGERIALVTNGRQWRLVFAGLDFDAWCEWDVDLWFEEGAISSQVTALRTLFNPILWIPQVKDEPYPLLKAILDSRKGQAELSSVLGERVREAVEILVQGHGDILQKQNGDIDPAEIYRAAVRVVMRMVVALFAESRELLPRDNMLYHGAYGLTGLLEDLEKIAARGGNRLSRSWSAWPRLLALFRLVHQGSHHEKIPVPAYGGELFAPGDATATDGLSRALAIFESACFEREMLPDRDVHRMLERLTRTKVRLQQGRSRVWATVPVDFSDLSSEYIGILYEGLLDFELKTAPEGDPVIFLALGNQPALPLSRLEAMDDRALADLLEKMKERGQEEVETGDAAAESPAESGEENENDNDQNDSDQGDDDGDDLSSSDTEESSVEETGDDRHATRTRAEIWARRAVEVRNLVSRPRGALTPERLLVYEDVVARKARQLVTRVILPGEWYLVRWGGTRKGAGTFYTRPGLAVPTVQRTLRPLAYDPPPGADGTPDADAPPSAWTPKSPEEIISLKVCDPACGSGTFPVATLRFLTDALWSSIIHHQRLTGDTGRSVEEILGLSIHDEGDERLSTTRLPCRPEDDNFEHDMKALLRRFVVERCIYGVDVDPLAVELCRLSLWIETMDRELPFSFLDHKIKCGNSLIGAWLDQFRHYPVMAWKNREGGDKNHTNGVHFEKESRTKALKAFVRETLTSDLRWFLEDTTLFSKGLQEEAAAVHTDALAVLSRLHELPIHESAERARIYRDEILGFPAWQALKSTMDLWCACWFWPADKLEQAPLPSTFHVPSDETRSVAAAVAAQKRFFHWEIEFPDVFCTQRSGFDAVLGNPPWETLQPNSKEYFSNIDPLYRAYGKQEALRHQTGYFADAAVEEAWLDYNAGFANESNWMKYAANPFGDPAENESSPNRFAIARGKDNGAFHKRWRTIRAESRGYGDPSHPFRHRGEGKAYTYKLFLEQAHALLLDSGRLGFIVPSGLYSDHGTGGLRRLFLDRCKWEWLFSFENREGIFDIHRSYKFNPVIIRKGGATDTIRTAFMRRKLEDWENADDIVTSYSREQVARFSPRSLAILEIQSKRDLEILEKIYANSVLLGDDGPDSWGIRYAQGDFNMTSDSKLFPPRPRWETQGYRPDEYSRWLKGNWRSIEELWAELGVDPDRPKSVEIELEDWLFDTSAGPEERIARAKFVHGHLLKPGDVHRTDWSLRCAQPPYDAIPIPRADIPARIILSREADAWILKEQIEDTALPLYQGVMVYGLSSNIALYERGAGNRAHWVRYDGFADDLHPQFLLGISNMPVNKPPCVIGFRALARSTDARTFINAVIDCVPCGNSLGLLSIGSGDEHLLFGAAVSSSYVFDWCLRRRIAGTNINSFFLWESPWPRRQNIYSGATQFTSMLAFRGRRFATFAIKHLHNSRKSWRNLWPACTSEYTRIRCMVDSIAAAAFGLSENDLVRLMDRCDYPCDLLRDSLVSALFDARGFWRVDKDKDPELRHTVLTLVAFHDLEEKIRSCGGDREKGIEAFLSQNNGEGWMLPETPRLADYGLGHDERAKHPQPVASRLGPRFYDWQLTQSAEESWRECHLHARNLLGETGYKQLLTDIEAEKRGEQRQPLHPTPSVKNNKGFGKQGELF